MELQVIDKTNILDQEVTTYGDLENPLFLAKDVAEWIEHSKPSIMIETVDEDEKLKETIFTSGQNREMWFLTEDGLYEVLMQSRKPIAKQFKKKVKKLLKHLRLNKFNPYTNMSKELQAIFALDNKTQAIEIKVDKLYDVMTIDYSQQENIRIEANRVAIELLGGKGTLAYKRLSRPIFQALWRDYKSYFKVNSYKNTATKDYDKAINYIERWQPNTNLKLAIEELNNQLVFA
ncbi:ORF6C domain-containing protein [Romboutsia maritimum]|uniref:ORF6C domain-containing protein n=1 Tax=Romboutsia maritimum TaxID=2020948 RepID=UPI001314BBF9|nr:ORF6C domain-containing protein [Romboutsia maritimum]